MKSKEAKRTVSLQAAVIITLFVGVVFGILIGKIKISNVVKSLLSPTSKAHITGDVTSLAITITSPQNGQIIKSGTLANIYATVLVNGVGQFAYSFEAYVNGERICKDGIKGNNRQLTALDCDWRAPRVKTETPFTIMVKATAPSSTGELLATDSINVIVK